jgi:hypothetical protein
MTQRILGPTGGRRRSRTRLAALCLIVLGALMVTSGAQAVHDVSIFQLDTPSADAQTATGSTAHLEDWDLICKDNPTTCTFKTGAEPAGSTTATSSSHVNDGALNATIFQGGGSKDISDISSWAWKDEAGGLPDKDNLLHAYAARYTVPTSPECPGAGGNTDGTLNCSLIYFGSDRYDNSGDATQAFWFLQNRITLGSNKVGGAFGFNGVHRDGDLLVISEFSNGGLKSTITIYKWVAGALVFVTGGEGQKCGGTTPDAFCGIVNEAVAPTFSPWPFLDKGGSENFRQGELYEAGINLSDPSIALADECFASFVAETRSSTSTTAQLKDFVLGQFEVCVPEMKTQASTNGTVTPGTPVTDSATITVKGAANPTDPTGNVTFFLCANATNGCPTGGTNIGTGTLVGGTPNDGIAIATSPTVNDSAQTGARGPLAPGRYCFRAEWPGDATYVLPNPPLTYTDNVEECFSVKDTTAIATTQSWLPQDAATITTGSGAAAPPGTVVFSLYENGTCSGTAATTFTDNDGSNGYTTNNSTYRTASTIISWSATFTPNDPNAFAGSTTTMCERSDLTINNAASPFPPGP